MEVAYSNHQVLEKEDGNLPRYLISSSSLFLPFLGIDLFVFIFTYFIMVIRDFLVIFFNLYELYECCMHSFSVWNSLKLCFHFLEDFLSTLISISIPS
jgi:hypothetical protein